jgi:hypothetical protein
MPRQSAEARSIEMVAMPAAKLAPPAELTEEQAAIWRSIVDRLPPAWFGSDNARVLVELVRHVSYSRKIAAEMDAVAGKLGPSNRRLFLQLGRAHALQSNRIADLSTRLRLTNQSVNRDRAEVMRKREAEGPMPWEDYGQQTN